MPVEHKVMWGRFGALPAYFGGKRRLAPILFTLLDTVRPRRSWPKLTLLDPFLGGGSVSLYAKAQGLHVICNDLSLRSAVVGRGLIANSAVRLTRGHLVRLLKSPDRPFTRLAEEKYAPSVFPPRHARLLDRAAVHNLQALCEPERSLATVLVIKWALRIQPMSQLRGTDAKAAFGGDLDRVSPHRLRHYLEAEMLLRAEAWFKLASQINQGVFAGRGEAEEDALTFIRGHRADVVYLDPPYPGTTVYEREYAVLDHLLEGETRAVSRFSKSPNELTQLLRACAHVPVWLVSLNNGTLSLGELEAAIHRHRQHVRSLEVPYRHLGSIASEEKNAENREFLILAW